MKSWKSRSRKIENFSCFLVLWSVRKFVLRHENLCKKKIPTSQKTLFISSKQWIKKCRKEKKWIVANQKSRNLLIFHVSCVLYGTKFLLERWKLLKKHFPHSQKKNSSVLSTELKNVEKNEKWIVANQKSRKIIHFSCFLVFCTEIFTKDMKTSEKKSSHFSENNFHQF